MAAKVWQCDICGEQFNSRSALRRHVAAGCAKRPHRRRKLTDLPSFDLEGPEPHDLLAPELDASAPFDHSPDGAPDAPKASDALLFARDPEQLAREQGSAPTDPTAPTDTDPCEQPPCDDLHDHPDSHHAADAYDDVDGSRWAELEARLIAAAADLHLHVDADMLHGAFQHLREALEQAPLGE